jgi:transposase
VKRLVAQELTLSFVPDAEQRLWRTVMRRKYQITRNRVQLHSRLESLLEEAHIKLGTSARRMLQTLADGETDPATVASLADQRLRATASNLSQIHRTTRHNRERFSTLAHPRSGASRAAS